MITCTARLQSIGLAIERSLLESERIRVRDAYTRTYICIRLELKLTAADVALALALISATFFMKKAACRN